MTTRVVASLAGALIWAATPANAAQPVARPQQATVVIDADTGNVLHAANADARHYPASLTKMMTLYLTFEALEAGRLRLDQRLAVSSHAASQEPTKLGLEVGDTLTVRDAVLALIVKSANDVAVVVGESLGGSEERFAAMMTARAREIGMSRTTFRNASGLPDPDQTTTARDMATLAHALVRDFPKFYPLFATAAFNYEGATIPTHNRLLNRYSGMDGIKTGYIRDSGFNLAASAMRDGRRLVGVVLGGTSQVARDRLMAQLLDKGFHAAGGSTTVAQAAAPARPPAAAKAPASPNKTTAKAAKPGSPAPTPPPPAADDGDDSGWSIQVGAFARFQQAQRAAETVTDKLGLVIAGTSIAILPVSNKKGTLYRARLTGLAEAEARKACQQLLGKKDNAGCLLIPPT
ncbi:MAG: D-alanyl-D-alanine carboxypeptidase [Rhodospirillaceae bacterium]|nr:D-alanyl-D-alanine carboxypeptidase [Rhodospirillaceae bacterium]